MEKFGKHLSWSSFPNHQLSLSAAWICPQFNRFTKHYLLLRASFEVLNPLLLISILGITLPYAPGHVCVGIAYPDPKRSNGNKDQSTEEKEKELDRGSDKDGN